MVETRGRLIEQQETGLGRQGAGELHALLRAERQVGDAGVRDVAEREQFDQFVRPRRNTPRLAPHQRQPQRVGEEATAAHRVCAEHHVLDHRQGAEQRQVLESAADADTGHAMARQCIDDVAIELDSAGLVAVEPRQAVEQRGLARAVGPDEAADLAFAHLEADRVEGDDAAEMHRHVAHAEQGGHGPWSGIAGRWGMLRRAMKKRGSKCGNTDTAPRGRASERVHCVAVVLLE